MRPQSNPLPASVATTLSLTLALGLCVGIGPKADANILSNPGFETPTTTTAANVLGNFPGFAGVWGPEVGAITTATLGVTPASGSRMLGMTTDGASYTQTFQAIDVSSFAGLINSGMAQLNAGALLNTNGGYTGAFGAVNVEFFSGPAYGTLMGNSGSGTLTLDANPLTWQSVSVTSAIPVGTMWLVFQVAYQNASIGNNTGFVDDAYLNITQVPAPGALAALGLAACGARRRRR